MLGTLSLYRQEVRAFTDKQIALLQNFAAQAVIAMENARLITEQREALEQQTATAEVLQVINASPGNLTPVFEAMLEKAIRLCGGDRAYCGLSKVAAAALPRHRGLPAEFVALLRERGESGTNAPLQRIVQGEWLIEFPDTVEEFSRSGDPHAKGAVEAGVRSAIWVAIVKEGVTVGAFAIGRSVIGTFSDKQIALLQNFAAQAVIAMENARLIDRTAGGAGAADRDRRSVAGDQCFAGQVDAGVRRDAGKGIAAVRRGVSVLSYYMMVSVSVLRRGATVYAEEFADLIRQPFRPDGRYQRLIDGERFVQAMPVDAD